MIIPVLMKVHATQPAESPMNLQTLEGLRAILLAQESPGEFQECVDTCIVGVKLETLMYAVRGNPQLPGRPGFPTGHVSTFKLVYEIYDLSMLQ